ncbi:MAG: acyl carrier protein [Tissierellia bacterium]|nr:acyl carrier protein [Tissierellia bacterium]
MKEKIKKIIRETLQIQGISDSISRIETAEWDSLKHLIIISKLEAEFMVSIEPEDITVMDNLLEIEKILKRLLNK